MQQPTLLDQLWAAALSDGARALRAQKAADVIRRTRAYRWVGIYEVERDQLALVAWSGFGMSVPPRLPVAEGRCGTADRADLAILASSRSEMVVPILGGETVIGVIGVETDRAQPLVGTERAVLRDCAAVLAALWGDRPRPGTQAHPMR